MSAALDTSMASLSKFSRDIQKFGGHVHEAGMAMAPMSAAVGYLGYQALSMSAEFEYSMNRVRAVTGATRPEIEKLEVQAKQLGASTIYTAQEAAEAMAFFGLAGFSTNEIYESMPHTLQLAAAASIGIGQAADITAKILRGYNIETQDLGRVNDVLVKAFTSANTNLVQLGESFKHAGPVASIAGIQFEEAAAVLSMMGDAGFQASLAGTSFRNAIISLLDPVGKGAKVAAELGLVIRDAGGNMLPMVDIFKQLEDKGVGAEEMMAMFGKRGGPAMIAALRQGSGELEKFTTMLEGAGGTAERIEKIQLEGLKGAVILMSSAWENAMISIGESLDKYATEAVRMLTHLAHVVEDELIPWFNQLPESVRRAAVGFGVLIALAGPVLITLGAMIKVFGFTVEMMIAPITLFGKALLKLGVAEVLIQPLRILAAQIEIFGLRTGISTTATLLWSQAMGALKAAQMWLWANSALYANISVYGLQTGLAITATNAWASAMKVLQTAQMWLWSNSKLYANISVYGLQTGLAITATSAWASVMKVLQSAQMWLWANSKLYANISVYGLQTGIAITATTAWASAMKVLQSAQMWLWANSKLYANISVYGLQTGVAITATYAWSVASGYLSAALVGVRAALTFLTGPVGLVITGVTLLVALFTQTETGTKLLGRAWEWLKDIGESFSGMFSSLSSIMHDLFAIGFMLAKQHVEALVEQLRLGYGIVIWVKDGIVSLGRAIGDVIGVIAEFSMKLLTLIPGGELVVEGLRKLRSAFSSVDSLLQTVAGGVHQVALDLGAVKDELPKVTSPMKALNVETAKQENLAYLLSDAFTNELTPNLKKTGEGVHELTEEEVEHAKAVQKIVEQYSGAEAKNGFKVWTEALPKIGDLSRLSQVEQEDLTKKLGEFIDKAVAMGETVPPEIQRAYTTLANNTIVKKAFQELADEARKSTTKILEEQHKQAQEVAKVRDKQFSSSLEAAIDVGEKMFAIRATETEKAINMATKERDETLRAIEPLKKLWPEKYEQARQQTLVVFEQAVRDAREKGATIRDTFANKMGELPNVIMNAIQGGGDVFKSILGHVGTSIMSGDNALTRMLYGGLSKIGTKIGGDFGASLSTSLSNAVPGIGAAIGPAFMALGKFIGDKLFGSAGRDAVKEFAATFEGGFDGLREKLNALGAEGERLWVNLTQGVGKNNPAQAKAAIEAINAALAAHEAELKAVQDALSKYNVTWQQMEGEAYMKGLSTEIKKLAEDTRLLVLGGLSHEGALKAQAEAYNKLILEGTKLGDKMPVELMKVAREMASLGLLTEETIGILLNGAQQALPSWQDMEAAAEKYGIKLEDLGKEFRAAKLGDLFKEYAADFDLLIRGGADMSAVTEAMAGKVNEAVQQAIKFGVEIPASMRPMLEALAASGRLLDENGNVIKDISGLKFGETMAESTDRLIKKLDELIKALTGGVGGAIDQIVRRFEDFTEEDWQVNVNVRATGSAEGQGPGAEAMAAGGMFRVTKPTLFLAGEAGAEDAYFSGGGRSFSRPGAAAYPGEGGGGDVYILVERDGSARRLSREDFKQLEQAMANGLVKVPRRAIGERVQ